LTWELKKFKKEKDGFKSPKAPLFKLGVLYVDAKILWNYTGNSRAVSSFCLKKNIGSDLTKGGLRGLFSGCHNQSCAAAFQAEMD